MAIDAINGESTAARSAPVAVERTEASSAIGRDLSQSVAHGSDSGAGSVASEAEVSAAVSTLDAVLNAGPNPSFDLDYLSGLSVVTVKSKATGEVVFQLPDRRAVELARLVKQGESLQSLGALDITA